MKKVLLLLLITLTGCNSVNHREISSTTALHSSDLKLSIRFFENYMNENIFSKFGCSNTVECRYIEFKTLTVEKNTGVSTYLTLKNCSISPKILFGSYKNKDALDNALTQKNIPKATCSSSLENHEISIEDLDRLKNFMKNKPYKDYTKNARLNYNSDSLPEALGVFGLFALGNTMYFVGSPPLAVASLFIAIGSLIADPAVKNENSAKKNAERLTVNISEFEQKNQNHIKLAIVGKPRGGLRVTSKNYSFMNYQNTFNLLADSLNKGNTIESFFKEHRGD